MRNIVVLTGNAGAGKTTIAKQLVTMGYHRVRFAEALKKMAAAIGLNEDEIDGSLKETPCVRLTFQNFAEMPHASCPFEAIGIDIGFDGAKHIEVLGVSAGYALTTLMHIILSCIAEGGPEGATPRRLMQMLGTDWGRKMIREDLWVDLWRREINALPSDANVVIDDCRFPNELLECQTNGRATTIRVLRESVVLTSEAAKAHESEQHVLPYDFVVRNNGTPADAAERVRHVVWEGMRAAA